VTTAGVRALDNDRRGKWALLYNGHNRAPGRSAALKDARNRRARRRLRGFWRREVRT